MGMNATLGGLSVYIPLVFLLACNYVMHLLFPIRAHVLGEPMLTLQLVCSVLQHLLVASDRSVLASCQGAAWQRKSSLH